MSNGDEPKRQSQVSTQFSQANESLDELSSIVMSRLDKCFDEEIENQAFTIFEMRGFIAQPKLALKAGMAIGYKMALDDCASQQGNTADQEIAAFNKFDKQFKNGEPKPFL
jgi:hypothetical protein